MFLFLELGMIEFPVEEKFKLPANQQRTKPMFGLTSGRKWTNRVPNCAKTAIVRVRMGTPQPKTEYGAKINLSETLNDPLK